MRNGKRIYVSAFKAWLVEQALKPEVSVAGLALRHGVNANQLRSWMKLEHWQSSPHTLLPVTVVADARPAEVVATTNARQPEAEGRTQTARMGPSGPSMGSGDHQHRQPPRGG